VFPSVEVNSTFYRIPKLATAEKWRREADEINDEFIFTVKASKTITHVDRFASNASLNAFSQMLDICAALRAEVLLLQSPESFRPTEENRKRLERFLTAIRRPGIQLAWEPRGKWWDAPDEIRKLCERFKLIGCVDPFRHDPPAPKTVKTGYFRLHGFGKPSMYMYRFSNEELKSLKEKCFGLGNSLDSLFVFFNNALMYENALEFLGMI